MWEGDKDTRERMRERERERKRERERERDGVKYQGDEKVMLAVSTERVTSQLKCACEQCTWVHGCVCVFLWVSVC